MVSMFKAWCSKNKFTKGEKQNRSHVLMNGGSLYIPHDRVGEFCDEYIKAVTKKEKLYLVEQKTPTYNFFLDIDYKDEDAMQLDYLQKLCRIICDKVKMYGGRDCLICVSKPKEVDDGLIKTGVHLNWSNFVVDQEGANNLRDHVIATLISVFKNKNWNQIIDNSVYGDTKKRTAGSGFRMPWSYKKGKHIACQGQGCSECDNTGKITEPPYLPIFKYVYGHVMCRMDTLSQDPSVDILKDSIVRTDVTEVTTVPAIDGNKKNEGSFTEAQMKDEFMDDEARAYLETFIRQNMEGQEDARITKMFHHKNQFLVSTTSKYCENLRRSHNSNHIWFHLIGKTITQKCFCRCETIRGRFHGFCADFRGREHMLNDTIVSKLYPDVKPPVRPKTPPQKAPVETDKAVETLNAYINKCICPAKIIKITKNKTKYIADAEMTECDYGHRTTCQFIIDKSGIELKCPDCKDQTHRKNILNTKTREILFPTKK